MRPERLMDSSDLVAALDLLAARDADLAREYARIGAPVLRRWPSGFETLLNIILGQQVSTAAARAIRDRMKASIGEIAPEGVLAAEDALLRRCGLSAAKIGYVKNLARLILEGRVCLEDLEAMSDEKALAHLTAVKGIGAWTAEVYLLFAQGRRDLWPADDIAVLEALRYLRGWAERPAGKARRTAGEAWVPLRGAAAHFLWHLYRNRTDRDALVVEATVTAGEPARARPPTRR